MQAHDRRSLALGRFRTCTRCPGKYAKPPVRGVDSAFVTASLTAPDPQRASGEGLRPGPQSEIRGLWEAARLKRDQRGTRVGGHGRQPKKCFDSDH
ncbi:hypothetical protein EVAR_39069_1 [Eumeta japonica]|uniref:Uncharacterized protein n=1 Tax=Eumeta variegata TaxID=151549 RepID=A0A4C1WM64_EUMVA|nr:hypothetical protein EVAR_39069_1 [Eumeta japonica]